MNTVTIAIIITVIVYGMVIALFSRLINHQQQWFLHNLNELHNETLFCLLRYEYQVSEYVLFEAISKSRFGRVVPAYVDGLYENWIHRGKVDATVREFIIDVLQGRRALHNTLIA